MDHAGACYDEHEMMVQAKHSPEYVSARQRLSLGSPISLECLLQWNDVNGHDKQHAHMQPAPTQSRS